jgi:hypothetical protein
MGTFGGFATFPLELGGDASSLEKTYAALRGSLGIGGVAVDDSGIDGLILEAHAMGLDAIFSLDERAALQAFPSSMIDNLPDAEEILRIVPPPGATEADRRATVVAKWTKRISSEIPTLQALLTAIDSRLTVLDTGWANSFTMEIGRAFEPYVPGPTTGPAFLLGPTGTKSFSKYPAYSSRDEVVVLFDLGAPGTIPGNAELRILAFAKALLDDVLPSCVRPYLITEVGLIAGLSPVGYAGVTG